MIYRPESKRASHYFEAALPRPFDLWVWIEETQAVSPLASEPADGAADTWPFAL